ncbi:YycH family regulatory protein [Jeotgalibacillus aurantiacus]|uniref:YycH family regulatory protein n=1 Tax=Jeotgalibacillus aurantiacus TaxID=2763266 RepID=UPI001D09BFBB|nr:two-component system activity regulator YycH [Jeotgalibacillus aurantiacus]
MRIELFKSILLTLLVVLSGLLTWNVWSYQPSTETFEAPTTIDVAISEERDIDDLIKPLRFLVHEEEAVYGASASSEVETLLSQMSDWSIFSIRQNTSLNEEEFLNLVHGPNRIEVVFPVSVPFNTYRDVLRFEDSNLPQDSFNRIVIDVAARDESTFTVYFVHYENRVVYESRVDRDSLAAINRDIVLPAPEKYMAYARYDTGRRSIFVPANRLTPQQYGYRMERIDIELFRQALFSNPDDINYNSLASSREQYVDNSNLLEVNNNTNMISFVNLTSDEATVIDATELITNSRRFVNDHSGWTGDYYLANLDPMNQQVTYRMHIGGVPIFSEDGVSEINQEWGSTIIHKYSRSFLQTQFPLPTESATKTLQPGLDVISQIESREENYEPELLEDVTPAYRMIRDSQNALTYTLDPSWYYKYDGVWKRVPEQGGGDPIGLE